MKKDYIPEDAERRFVTIPVEVREEGDHKYFEGDAVIFNSVTDLGWFTEEIRDGAFDEVMKDDVRALFNHDPNVVLGRSTAGTMELHADKKKVKYKVLYNENDPDHVRVMEKVKRGDVSQSSFAFSIKDDEWSTRDGKDHRVVTKVMRWYDISPVTYPAYQDTTVAARSFEKVRTETQHMIDEDEEREDHLRNYYKIIGL